MARVKFLQHMSGSWSVHVRSTMGFVDEEGPSDFCLSLYTTPKKLRVNEDIMSSLLFYLLSRLFAEELSSTNQLL